MTEIYFVRHAQPDYKDHDDAARALTEKGMRDRTRATQFLSDKNISAVLSSPYKRAVDTVREFAEQNTLPILTDFDFRERRVDSVWVDDFDAFCRQQWADFDYRLTDGETLRMVQDRNLAALHRVLTKYAGQNVAVGSHGTALSTLIHYFDPTFGHDDFLRIKGLMPWIVQFTFDSETCIAITEHDVFTGNTLSRPISVQK